MTYTERYEVRMRDADNCWVVLHQFDDETDAISYMEMVARGPGVWRVVRVMEATVASTARRR